MADGQFRLTDWDDIVAGTVLREVSRKDGRTTPQFGDSVVVSVSLRDPKGDAVVKLARPHMLVNASIGSWSVSVESFEVPASRLIGEDSIFRTVLLDRGQPANVAR